MDHEGTREQLELAAVEPGGLERLMAGDTPTAQAVAAHLAGCPSCSDELVRLQRAATLIGGAVRELPPADLKARTLAAIRAEGVRRPLVAPLPVGAGGAGGVAAPDALAEPTPLPVGAGTAGSRSSRSTRSQWLGFAGTIAAAVVLSVVSTTFVVNNRVDSQLAAQGVTIAALEKVTKATMDVSDEPDAEHVALTAVADPAVGGSLVYSPSTVELVIVAEGLQPPPSGQEYGCWVEVDGQRERVGRMVFSPTLAYWLGKVPELTGVSDGATFGVSLVSVGSTSVDADPVLVGEL
jgi:hypothetical protein